MRLLDLPGPSAERFDARPVSEYPLFVRFREDIGDAVQDFRPVEQGFEQIDLGAFDVDLEYPDIPVEVFEVADEVDLPDLYGRVPGDIGLAGDNGAGLGIAAGVAVEPRMAVKKGPAVTRARSGILDPHIVEVGKIVPKRRAGPGVGFEGDHLRGLCGHLSRISADIGTQVYAGLAAAAQDCIREISDAGCQDGLLALIMPPERTGETAQDRVFQAFSLVHSRLAPRGARNLSAIAQTFVGRGTRIPCTVGKKPPSIACRIAA